MAMIAPNKRSDAADDCHHVQSSWRDGIQRHAPGKHVHSGGDHRGGVDQSADGRRAFHGVGQPHVQGKLCALAASAEQ